MGNFTAGLTFSDTAPGNIVNAARLATFIQDADATTDFITTKTETTSLAADDYFLVYDDSAVALRKVSYAQLSSSPVGLAAARGLIVKNNSGSPATTVDITANEALLRDSNGVLIRFADVSESVNITSSGASGLDTGGEESATWYFIWLISNGSTINAMLSKSGTAPTMPSGYDYKLRIGGVFNNSSSDFWTFRCDGDDYKTQRQAQTLSSTSFTANSDPTVTTNYVTLLLNGSSIPYIPSVANEVYGTIGDTAGAVTKIIVAASNTGLGAQICVGSDDGATTTDSFRSSSTFRCPVATAQTIFAKSAVNITNTARIVISGFRILL